MTKFCIRRLLAADPLGLSSYIYTDNSFRYVDCKFFVDKFELSTHSKKHMKEFVLTVIRQMYQGDECDVILIKGQTKVQQRYIRFSWFIMFMIVAPSHKLPRTPEREAWIQHWLGGAVPNVSRPAAEFTWNREPVTTLPTVSAIPPVTPQRRPFPPPSMPPMPHVTPQRLSFPSPSIPTPMRHVTPSCTRVNSRVYHNYTE